MINTSLGVPSILNEIFDQFLLHLKKLIDWNWSKAGVFTRKMTWRNAMMIQLNLFKFIFYICRMKTKVWEIPLEKKQVSLDYDHHYCAWMYVFERGKMRLWKWMWFRLSIILHYIRGGDMCGIWVRPSIISLSIFGRRLNLTYH